MAVRPWLRGGQADGRHVQLRLPVQKRVAGRAPQQRGTVQARGQEITIQNGEGLCVTSSGHKNGAKILAKKCKDGSSTQQWQIGPM